MKDKAIIGSVGPATEIDMAGLKGEGHQRINIKPQYDGFAVPDWASVLILAEDD